LSIAIFYRRIQIQSAPQTIYFALYYGYDCPGIDYPAEHLFEIFVADHSPAQTFDMSGNFRDAP